MPRIIVILLSLALISGCGQSKKKKKSFSADFNTEEKEKEVAAPKEVKKKPRGRVGRKIREILDNDGDVNQYITSKGQADSHGILMLVWAINHNDYDLVKEIVKRGAEVDKSPGKAATWTALFEAIDSVQITSKADRPKKIETSQKILALLVKHGANVNHAKNTGETPLLSAAAKGRSDICAFLIRSGANVNAVDVLGQSPLHHAAIHGYHNVVRVLLKAKAKTDLKNRRGQTALALAHKRADLADQNDMRKVLPEAYSDADYDKTIDMLQGQK